MFLRRLFVSAALLVSSNILAFSAHELQSPVGYWMMRDDTTHLPRAVIKIFPVTKGQQQTLSGSLEMPLYVSGKKWSSRCDQCISPWTNKPLHKLVFLWGFQHQNHAWNSPWVGGNIFRIESGNEVYRSQLWLTDQGRQMKIRGYSGIFYDTQDWVRIGKKELCRYQHLYNKQVKIHPFKSYPKPTLG